MEWLEDPYDAAKEYVKNEKRRWLYAKIYNLSRKERGVMLLILTTTLSDDEIAKQSIDELLGYNEETNTEISKDIREGIIKSVYIRVLISLVVIALLIVGGYFGLSKIYQTIHLMKN